MIVCRSNRWDSNILGEIEETSIDALSTIFTESQQCFVMRSSFSVRERIWFLYQFLALYKAHRSTIAEYISLEIGKAITHSLADVDYDINYIERHLEHAEEILASETIYKDQHTQHIAYYEAIWVAAVISPWNYPSSQLVWQIIPPLLAGNTIIYKPASACMWTAKCINDLLLNCLPHGVFQPIYGSSILWNELTKLPVDLIIFTGSTQVGQQIQHNAAQTMAQTHLELWWSAPGIILPDTLIDDAMMQTIDYFRIWHSGQICDGLKRLFVHHSQYHELVEKLQNYFSDMVIGNPLDPLTHMGMLISPDAKTYIQWLIDQSIAQGATKIEIWHYDGTPGPWMPVIFLMDVTLDMPVMTKEVFWPVLPIMTYDTIDEVITYANTTIYGLWAYLRGQDKSQIDYVCRRLHTGNISVNNTSYLLPQVPFGWYTSASGNFREHGRIGLRNYTTIKVISSPIL